MAAEQSCDLYWNAADHRWVVASISYDADACSLSGAELARISPQEFLERYIPDRP
jgi:hypothetical protein